MRQVHNSCPYEYFFLEIKIFIREIQHCEHNSFVLLFNNVFFLHLNLLNLAKLNKTNDGETSAEVEQQPLLMDNCDKTHNKGML